jgi:hypothetical protein
MTNTYLDQDYAQWLDISFFRKHLTAGLSSTLSENIVSTLANVCAITHAMKMRDFNAGLTAQPESKEVTVGLFVNNLSKYLSDDNSSEDDWLELFIAGHDTGKDKDVTKGKDQQQTTEQGDDRFNDDEYVRMAALSYMKANSNDIAKQQQMVAQILKAQQQHTLHRNKYIQKRISQKSWLSRIIDYFIRGVDVSGSRASLLGIKKKKKKRFITIPSIISGITSGVAIIAGMQLFPAYGFLTFAVSAFAGYFAGLGLYKSIRNTFVGGKGGSEAGHSHEKEREQSKEKSRERSPQISKEKEHEVAKAKELEISEQKIQEVEKAHKLEKAKELEREKVVEQKKELAEKQEFDKHLEEQKKNIAHRHNEKQGIEDTTVLDKVLVDAIKFSIKAASAAADAAGQIMTPEKTPQVNKAANSTHASRLLESANSGGGGSGRGL